MNFGPIKTFDRQNLKDLRNDFDQAVAGLAKKYGIAISLGNIRFDAAKATSKVEFVVTTPGTANPREALMAADFSRYAESFGLKPEQYGETFTFGFGRKRNTYKLVGLKPRSPKRPIVGTSLRDGKDYIFPESAIASLQSAEHKKLYGITTPTPTALGMCSNDNAYDAKFKPIGKCNRPATTTRKSGFSRDARMQPFCDQCAQLIDESRAEMAAEGRAS